MDVREPSGGVYYNVVRSTSLEEEKKRLALELLRRKGSPTSIRFSPEEEAMIMIIQRITGMPSKSAAIRVAISIAWGLLSQSPEIQAGRVVIQSPIVNLNINNNKNEVKPTININIKQEDIQEIKQLLETLVTYAEQHFHGKGRQVLRQRVLKATKILDRLLEGVN